MILSRHVRPLSAGADAWDTTWGSAWVAKEEPHAAAGSGSWRHHDATASVASGSSAKRRLRKQKLENDYEQRFAQQDDWGKQYNQWKNYGKERAEFRANKGQ